MSESIKEYSLKSLRSFIGAKDFEVSKNFYLALGFEVMDIDPKMCLIKIKDNLCFYLQDSYVKDWINNSMLFLEVEELNAFYTMIQSLDLSEQFKGVRLTEIRNKSWGREFFMHDPSGVLWHFGNFNS